VLPAQVRFGALVDIRQSLTVVRFTPERRHLFTAAACPANCYCGSETRTYINPRVEHLLPIITLIGSYR
jgi:hypothetical protein